MKTASAADATISPVSHLISVKGKQVKTPAFRIGDHVVVIRGRMLKIAEIFDEYWVEADRLPDPKAVAGALGNLKEPPDLFVFTQRAPETQPKFEYYSDCDNVAAIPITTHAHWLKEQVSAASRRNIKTSEKRGVSVRQSEFNEEYIRGIMAISDESPIRAGRKYWHYGKDFATVEAEQGTYRDRSTFLAAYLDDEMIGYLKIVWDRRTAALMQIVSKMAHRDKRTNNALLSEAVRLCAERGVEYFLYEKFVYGNKVDSSLTRFKRENGFVRLDLPRYYVPLTAKGRMALRVGLQRNPKDRLPQWLTQPLLDLRDKWNARLASEPQRS